MIRIELGERFVEESGRTAARLDHPARGTVRVTGGDRVRFLDGMLSNHVAALGPGESCPALLLERKGHVVCPLFAIARAEDVLLDTAPDTGPELSAALDRFVIADDVEVVELSHWGRVAIEGPAAGEALAALAAPRPEPGRLAADGELWWWGGGYLTGEGFRVLGPRPALEARLAPLELPRLDAAAAEVLRVAAFVPRYGVDVTGRSLPQEARLEESLSFTKGCYVGQEIVARIRSRGAVNRLLVQLECEGKVEAGAPIRAEGKVVGEVTSAVVPSHGPPLALGYVRVASAAPGSRVDVGGVRAAVRYPPLPS